MAKEQLADAIGVPFPVSLMMDTFGTVILRNIVSLNVLLYTDIPYFVPRPVATPLRFPRGSSSAAIVQSTRQLSYSGGYVHYQTGQLTV